jgi:NADH:ubiquinone oxidoreductase subunit 5 (subunit L)/multisubunit Na+/H+ antiporter MnhA subunit
MDSNSKIKAAKIILLLAAVYNIFWGAVISLCPQIILFGNSHTSFMLILIRCIGMLVGVYGIAYYFSSTDPQRYWPLILVGFIGKVLGPIGSLYYVFMGELTPRFLWVNLLNDFIWLLPFGWILWQILKGRFAVNNSQDKATP